MLEKGDIIQIVENFDFPRDHYWVTAGAALVLHGVKHSTSDIDIGCTSALFEALIKRGHPTKQMSDGTRTIELAHVELLEEWRVDQIVYLRTIPVASLDDIIRQKRELGRAKDQADILLIERFQREQSSSIRRRKPQCASA